MIYKLTVCTTDSRCLCTKNFNSETRAHDAFIKAVEAQKDYKVDTIAVLFEDNVIIKLNEHKWVEWVGSPPIKNRVTTFRPSPEQQERFRQVLKDLRETNANSMVD